jgi:hypothetical protein
VSAPRALGEPRRFAVREAGERNRPARARTYAFIIIVVVSVVVRYLTEL